jgi:G3E family GTPase
VDAATCLATFEQHPEAVAQVAVADRLVVTKSDLVDDIMLDRVASELNSLNPRAPSRYAIQGQITPDFVFNMSELPLFDVHRCDGLAASHHHSQHRVASFHTTFEHPLDADVIYEWLEMLLALTSGDVLRVKGILNLAGYDRPVAIHGVQHLVHAPHILDRWPDDDRRSRIVLITRGIEPQLIEDTLHAVGVRCRLQEDQFAF